MTNVRFGWERPRDYVWWRWVFSLCWYRPIKQLRILGFYLTVTTMPRPNAARNK